MSDQSSVETGKSLALQFVEFAEARLDWLTAEIHGGGDFEHLNTRRSECAYVLGKFKKFLADRENAR